MSSIPEIRKKCGASACVKAVRAEFPKFDRPLLAKCEHPEAYGVKLLPGAEALIRALEAAGAAKPENRKKACRFYFRLTNSGAAALQRLCEVMGCATVQSLCEQCAYCREDIYEGTECFCCGDVLIHAECFADYVKDEYSEAELAGALGFREKTA